MRVCTTVSGKVALIASGKPLRPSTTATRYILDTPVLELIHDAQPELGALGLLDPQPEDLARAVGQHRQRDIDGFIPNKTLVPDLDPDGVEEDDRVAGIQRPVLPFTHFLKDRIRHRRDQVRRDIETVDFLQVAANLAHRHAARVHRDDLLVEVREATLILGNQLRIEGSRTIARDIQRHLRGPRQNRLLRAAVAPVRFTVSGVGIQMPIQLRV